ncbi:MAG: NAD(P)H-hydrate dehydratase [Balneolaceae bacterium]|nr:NAD(P)H-hydrate dehydratase [Balneolaceae bacterium]
MFASRDFYLGEGHGCVGEVILCELPFPNYLKSCNTFLLDRHWLKEPAPTPAKHKYDAGVLYIVAGSEGLTGAAMMTAQSAWAAGVGAVILICPRAILPVFENNLPQIIKKPVGSKDDSFFREEHLEDVLEIVREKEGDAVLGPGIGRNDTTQQFVTKFCQQYQGNLLIDADALWCLAQQEKWKKPESASWILTPHPGELARLVPLKINTGNDRLEAVRQLSSQKNTTIVSKGFPTIIATPDKYCFLTGYDTRIFARAGFGDVLSGKIGAYLALGNSLAKSAALGLLNGYEKIQSKQQIIRRLPEPNDLI